MPFDKDPSTGFNKFLAAQLRAERAARDISNTEIAERSGLSTVTVSRLLTGARMISTAQLASVCDGLGVPVRDVVAAAEMRAWRETGNIYGFTAQSDDIEGVDFEQLSALRPGYSYEQEWEQ